jgi:hypothetical protein
MARHDGEKQIPNRFGVFWIQVSRGLIGKHEMRLVNEGSGDRGALPFPAGHLSRVMGRAGLKLNVDEKGSRPVTLLLARHPAHMGREHDVFKGSEIL